MKYKLISLQKELEVKKIATLFYMEYDKNFDFPGEQHDFWELVYCFTRYQQIKKYLLILLLFLLPV